MPVDPASFETPSAGLLALGFDTRGGGDSDHGGVSEWSGAGLARYELLERLGEGGFGMVWRARQHEPIRREVALKVIKEGLDSREVILRFEAERQALALMDHPNIAAVLDAGATADGRPFFVMELVQGPPVTEYCDRERLSLRERIALFIPICQAVQHAHQKAVLHRDLKPNNVLIAEIDGKPVPKVIDFGVAKALSPSTGILTEGPARTLIGTIVGTPQYMSPEQAGCGLDVDTRSDVYSLGVILCELLTGGTPIPAETGTRGDLAALLRQICEAEPVRPSSLVQNAASHTGEAAAQRGLESAKFAKTLRGDLDRITLKALDKDRTRRYETATALALDLRRWLDGKTVSAAAPTLRYQFGKFARRHRMALTATGLTAAALITGTAVSLWQAAKAERNRTEADINYGDARKAVEVYLSRVADHPKLQGEEFRELTRDLLEAALPFYEEMSRRGGSDADLRTNQAWALGRLGYLYLLLGNYPKSEAAYMEALRMEERLAEEFPGDPARRHRLSERHNNLAALQIKQQRPDTSLASQEKSLALMEPLVARYPGEAEYRQNLSAILLNMGTALGDAERFQESEASFRRAIEQLESLAAGYPDNNFHRFRLGSARLLLGNLFKARNQPDAAEQYWRDAVTAFETVKGEDSSAQQSRSSIGACLTNLGMKLCLAGQTEEGDACLKRAAEVRTELVRDFPAAVNFREQLILTWQSIAHTQDQRGDLKAAEAALENACAGQQRLASDNPRSRNHADKLAGLYAKLGSSAQKRNAPVEARAFYEKAAAAYPAVRYYQPLGELALLAGDHAAAAANARAMAKLPTAKWEGRERAAAILAGAAEICGNSAAADEYCREAVSLLREAMDNGLLSVAEFSTPARRSLLKDRPDFLDLLARPPGPLPAGSPVRFTFDYRYDDPGIRLWKRDGIIWTETQPSGTANVFTAVGRKLIEKFKGIELRRTVDGNPMCLFVPDLGEPAPRLLMKTGDDTWISLGPLSEIE